MTHKNEQLQRHTENTNSSIRDKDTDYKHEGQQFDPTLTLLNFKENKQKSNKHNTKKIGSTTFRIQPKVDFKIQI